MLLCHLFFLSKDLYILATWPAHHSILVFTVVIIPVYHKTYLNHEVPNYVDKGYLYFEIKQVLGQR
jgi:hypothetical protein